MKTSLIAAVLSVLLTGAVHAQSDSTSFVLGEMAHEQAGTTEWWHLPGIDLSSTPQGLAVNGEGRMLVHTQNRADTVTVGALRVKLAPQTAVFVDQVGAQVRVMILHGKAQANDGHRELALTTSHQVVISPEPNEGYFIDDGVYRRPFIQTFNDGDRKTLVRQFYLEQVVYSDPMLRTLYQQGGSGRELVDELNKTGAILRDVNGTQNYAPNQV